MKLAERGVWLGGKLWVREIRQLSQEGHQTVVVSTDFKSDLLQVACQMFSRWSQENWFKYIFEHFDLEGLGTYMLEPVSDTTRVVNSEARVLAAQIRTKAAQLSRCNAEYGRSELNEPLEVHNAEAYQNQQPNCVKPSKAWSRNSKPSSNTAKKCPRM